MSSTANFAMPLLFAAQAQKEMSHNEAIVLIDALLSGCIEAMVSDPAALTPEDGQAWIVGADPVGVWSGRAGQVAAFTAGGWRFAPAISGMRLYDRADELLRICDGTGWSTPPAIADPAGGATVDSEVRAVVTALLAALRESGMLAAT